MLICVGSEDSSNDGDYPNYAGDNFYEKGGDIESDNNRWSTLMTDQILWYIQTIYFVDHFVLKINLLH